MRALTALPAVLAAFAAVAHAQVRSAVVYDSAAVVRAIAESDSIQRRIRAATNAPPRTFFVNIGEDSVWERRVANALGNEFVVLPSGVTPRCHDGVAGSAPTGNRIAVEFAFASADSALVHVTMRCAGGSPATQFMHGSRTTYIVAHRNSRWIVLSVRARVS